VQAARAAGVPVLAANVPRRIAARVARNGSQALEQMSDEERAWVARELRDEPGEYRERFDEVMRQMAGGHGGGGHGGGGDHGPAPRFDQMFAAQALKDDTMAESIVDFL